MQNGEDLNQATQNGLFTKSLKPIFSIRQKKNVNSRLNNDTDDVEPQPENQNKAKPQPEKKSHMWKSHMWKIGH